MKRRQSVIGASILILLLFFMQTSTVFAALTLQDVKTWLWGSSANITTVVKGDVDGDSQMEIVTGGHYWDGSRDVAQLCVWDGSSLALENFKNWVWTSHTYIYSVAVCDIDGDGKVEIITGGYYSNLTNYNAQLCVWDGSSLALENVKTWCLESNAGIHSILVSDVDGDGKQEIVTGCTYNNGLRAVAQLYVWDGATLVCENVKTWLWGTSTFINSVDVGDVDGDGKVEIVTAGYYFDGTQGFAQLCVWDGATLTFEDVKTWYWTGSTRIESVAVGDVDADGQVEIITGGRYDDDLRYVAQLCVWNGATLALENVKNWYWTDSTYLESLVIGNVDSDGQVEIVTGGSYYDGTRYRAQLCVWDGASLTLENVRTWYWTDSTFLYSVAVGDVDGDGQVEIITGGRYSSGLLRAQLCIWE